MTNEEIRSKYKITYITLCIAGDEECNCGSGYFIVNNNYDDDNYEDKNIIYDIRDKIFTNEIDDVTENQLLEAFQEELK